MNFKEFKTEIYKAIDNRPNWARPGQQAFNYIEDVYGQDVARYVQFDKKVDCFYDDSKIKDFIKESWKRINRINNFQKYKILPETLVDKYDLPGFYQLSGCYFHGLLEKDLKTDVLYCNSTFEDGIFDLDFCLPNHKKIRFYIWAKGKSIRRGLAIYIDSKEDNEYAKNKFNSKEMFL